MHIDKNIYDTLLKFKNLNLRKVRLEILKINIKRKLKI